MSIQQRQLSVGIGKIDTQLDGGLPTGSVASVLAPPQSQVNTFLYQLTHHHNIIYITLQRPKDVIHGQLQRAPANENNIFVKQITETDIAAAVREQIKRVSDADMVVIDPIDVIEHQTSSDRYRELVGHVHREVTNLGAVLIAYGFTTDPASPSRQYTLHESETVLRFHTQTDADQTQLTVPKALHAAPIAEPITVELGQSVEVDSSYAIG